MTKKLLLEEFLDGPLEKFSPEKTLRGKSVYPTRASTQILDRSQRAA